MRLVLIHGAPATGKLTVARALAALTGCPLVDNHAAIEVARMVFGFGAPGFWGLVHELRVVTLRRAAQAGVPRLITTAAYSHPEDAELLADYEAAIAPQGGGIDPVHLHCPEETLMARVTATDRTRRHKIATRAGLAKYLAMNNFVALPRADCLSLSTEHATAAGTAAAIARHLRIPARAPGA